MRFASIVGLAVLVACSDMAAPASSIGDGGASSIGDTHSGGAQSIAASTAADTFTCNKYCGNTVDCSDYINLEACSSACIRNQTTRCGALFQHFAQCAGEAKYCPAKELCKVERDAYNGCVTVPGGTAGSGSIAADPSVGGTGTSTDSSGAGVAGWSGSSIAPSAGTGGGET